MRRHTIAGLFALIVFLAGCGSPSDLGVPPASDGQDLQAVASKFRSDPQPNRTVGADQMPLKFTDVEGHAVDLASFRGKSNVVLVVTRGLPKDYGGAFCFGCRAQVNSLTAKYEEFKKRDAVILMVFPGPKDALPRFLKEAKVDGVGGNPTVPFPLLADADLNAVRSLGIDGDRAKPSTYIIDKKGNVVFAYVAGADETTDRPSVQALLAQLDKLNAKK